LDYKVVESGTLARKVNIFTIFSYFLPCFNGIALGLYLAGLVGFYQAGFTIPITLPSIGWLLASLGLGFLVTSGSWWFSRLLLEKYLQIPRSRAVQLASFFDLSLLLLPVAILFLPLMVSFGSGLNLDVLGQIYLPGSNRFLTLPPAGYLYLLWAGPWVTLPLFLRLIFGTRLFLKKHAASEKGLPVRGRVLFGVALIFYLLLGAWTTTVYPPTGDEPHYLLMTQSLLGEGDIDLRDNMLRKDFRLFYPAKELDFHPTPTPTGQLISKHFPFLSLILVPAYAFLGRSGAVFVIMSVAALISVCLYQFALWFGNTKSSAVKVWLLSVVSIPLAVYFDLIYPELPATLVLLGGLLAWIRGGLLGVFGAAAAAAILPWFYPKYIPFSIFLGVLLPFTTATRPRQFILPGICIFISAIGYVLFFNTFYGFQLSENPYGRISMPFSSIGLRNALGLLIDRDFGIFSTSPVLLLGCLGWMSLVKKHVRLAVVVAGVFLIQYFLYILFDDFTGSAAVFSRQMILGTVLLFPLILQGWDRLQTVGPWLRAVGNILIIVSVFSAWLVCAWPFLRYLSPKQVLWTQLGFVPMIFPSLILYPDMGSFLWAFGWIAVLLLFLCRVIWGIHHNT